MRTALVASTDEELTRLLGLWLSELYRPTTHDGNAAPTCVPLLLDLDGKPTAYGKGYSCVIGISRDPDGVGDEDRRLCRTILRRPFGFDELESALRDAYENAGRRSYDPGKKRLPSLTLESAGRQVFCGRKSAALTPKEYSILDTLIAASGKTLSAESLCGAAGVGRNALGVHICSLRKKLGTLCGIRLISTERGGGYRL